MYGFLKVVGKNNETVFNCYFYANNDYKMLKYFKLCVKLCETLRLDYDIQTGYNMRFKKYINSQFK